MKKKTPEEFAAWLAKVESLLSKHEKKTPLESHSGSSGRAQFFEIARAMRKDTAAQNDNDEDSAGARKLLKSLHDMSLPPRPLLSRSEAKLKRLNLSSFGIGDNFAIALAEGLGELLEYRAVSFADNNLTDKSIPDLLRVAQSMKSLTFLDLSRNCIDGEGAGALRRLVKDQECALETLKLVHADVDDDECKLLCEAIASNPKCRLRSLDLSDNLIGQAETRNAANPEVFTGGEALSEVIEAECPTSLEELNLAWNFIRGDSALAIAKALAHNSHLKKLNLDYNTFGDVASQEIGRSLAHNTGLEELRMSSNNVSARAAYVIAQSIRRADKSRLRLLELNANSLGRKGGRALLHAVRDKEGSFSVKMENCTFDIEDRADVFDASKPEGVYDLDMTKAYDYVVANDLLRIATIRDGCRFASLRYSTKSQDAAKKEQPFYLTRKQVSQETDRALLWKPIIDRIFVEHRLPREDLSRVLRECRLNPSAKSLECISEFVDKRLAGFFQAERRVKQTQKVVTIDIATGQEREGEESEHESLGTAAAAEQPGAVVLDHGNDEEKSIDEEEEEDDEDVLYSVRAKATTTSTRFKAAARTIQFNSFMGKLLKKTSTVLPPAFNLARTGHHDKLVVNGQGKLTHEVLLSLIFRGAFRVVDLDNSGRLDVGEITSCGALLGLEIDLDEAQRIVSDFDDGDGLLSESEFVSYMLSLFLLPPCRHREPLLLGDDRWTPPENGFLRIIVESDPSVPSLDEVGTDAGVEALLKMISVASTEAERILMFELATDPGANGGYYTAAQAQRVIDTCGRAARLDTYDLCLRLSETMASTTDCCNILGANMNSAQGLALWCELGPAAFRIRIGNITGSYAFDLSVPRDRREFLRLAGSVHAERVKAKSTPNRPDTSQYGNWLGGFRNVYIDGVEIENFDPVASVATIPTTGILTCDVVSLSRPSRTEKPISGLRFAALLKGLRASQWKDAAKITAAEAAQRRARNVPNNSSYNVLPSLSSSESSSSLSHQSLGAASAGGSSPRTAAPMRSGRQRRGSVGASTATENKRGAGTFLPAWPSRRGHRLLSVENVISYYSQLRETSNRESVFVDPAAKKTIKYNRICMGCGIGKALDERDVGTLPSPRALSWIHLRIIELEFYASRLLFSAQQVFALWNHLPTGSLWADVRVQLVCILFRRTIDIENLPTVLFPNIAIDDLCQIRYRLGALNLLSPRSPDGFHRYRLDLFDEREAARVLVELAFQEPGENWIDSRYRRSRAWAGADWMPGWSLPTSWGDHIVEEGAVELTYVSSKPNWNLRDSQMSRCLCSAPLLFESKLRMTGSGTILRR